MEGPIEPHGGMLVDLMASPERAAELLEASRAWPSWDLTPRQLLELELLLTGAYSPLRGFMGRGESERVTVSGTLADGTPWPAPVLLEVSEMVAGRLGPGGTLALRDPEGTMLATLHVEEADGARRLVSGRIEGLRCPARLDFPELRRTPPALRREFARLGWTRVMAFDPGTWMHAGHLEQALRGARSVAAGLLIDLADGAADREHYGRVRAARALLASAPAGAALLTLVPPASSPLLRAVVRRNCGCTHVMSRAEATSGLQSVGSEPLVWLEKGLQFVTAGQVPPGDRAIPIPDDLSEAPEWLLPPGAAEEFRRSRPSRRRQGFAVFFTGLSGAGKSTIARLVQARLLERGDRPVRLLDGDIVRKHLSAELGFSREHRDLNVRRIGFVASEIVRSGGIVLCAPIAPYDAARREVRAMIASHGGFLLVHVSTSIEVCERRDPKGLYAKARAGLVPSFTGVSDPYEAPHDAEIVLDASGTDPGASAAEILNTLTAKGYL